jgi:predicted deacylase
MDTIPVRRHLSGKPGPNLLIFGAVHGNEVCGPHAIDRIDREIDTGTLRLLRGSLTTMRVCNPRAFAAHERMVEANLNRVCEVNSAPSCYEEHLAQELCTRIRECDRLLDLHSTTSETEPFAVVEDDFLESMQMTRHLGVKVVMTGWRKLYLKKYPDRAGMTALNYAASIGKSSVVVECGQHASDAAKRVAYSAICNLLMYLKIIDGTAPQTSLTTLEVTDVFFREEGQELLAGRHNLRRLAGREPIIKRADGSLVCAPCDCVAIMPNPIGKIDDDWLYLGVEKR